MAGLLTGSLRKSAINTVINSQNEYLDTKINVARNAFENSCGNLVSALPFDKKVVKGCALLRHGAYDNKKFWVKVIITFLAIQVLKLPVLCRKGYLALYEVSM